MLFFLPLSISKRKSNISWCLKTSRYTSQNLIYPFQPAKTSHVNGLMHSNVEKHQSSFDSRFLTSQFLIHGWFWVFKPLNKCTVPFLLLWTMYKLWSHISWSGSASKNNSDALFNACFTLNTLFYCFWDLLTSKYINRI